MTHVVKFCTKYCMITWGINKAYTQDKQVYLHELDIIIKDIILYGNYTISSQITVKEKCNIIIQIRK